MLNHVWGLFSHPFQEWEAIKQANYTTLAVLLQHTLEFAALPTIAGFVGTTTIGWRIGVGAPVLLTPQSAGFIAIAYYCAMVFAVLIVGHMIRWMSETYGADPSVDQCVVLASFSATPLFLIGIIELFPILWLNLLLGLPALAYTTHLFYSGVPVMLDIERERAFLLSTAMLAFGLVTLVALLAITAILWGTGFGPQFVVG